MDEMSTTSLMIFAEFELLLETEGMEG